MTILVENVSKQFGDFKALDGVNLEMKTGSLVALLGGSGSGKSTLLRIVAGFENPDTGRVWLHGKNCNSLSIQEREIGFVFQTYALFKHLTVYENIAFGLDNDNIQIIDQLLHIVQLSEFAHRYPSQLSGGQCQRVALARALAVQPKVLLLDEPFGALDMKVRKQLRRWLRTLHSKMPVTTLFVTHDHQEAMEVANEIVVLDKGRVKQIGDPKDIYERLYIKR